MVGEDGHAEVDQLWPTVGPSPAEAVELGGGGVEADLESFDFSEPAVPRASRMRSRRFWVISMMRPRWRGSIWRTGQRMQAYPNLSSGVLWVELSAPSSL